MLNLSHRSKTWFIASIFIATTISAQQNKNQTISSYSAPANIDLRNSWDVYATGSFIYWQASQENIEIGLISENAAENQDGPFETPYVNNMKITSPNFTFRPGFKFGLGANLNWDGWNTYVEYTRFHGSIGSGVKPLTPSTLTEVPDGQYLYPNQGAPIEIGFFFQDADQSWSLKMDFLDLSLARAYYSGTKLTVRSFFGARGAWIRQHLSTSYAGNSQRTSLGAHNANISNDSASWGIGPRVGFESNWMLGAGVRLIGNGSLDILYTRYSLRFNQQIYQTTELSPTNNPIHSNASVSQRIDYLRPHFDLEMGFGWGTYLCNNAYHFDLSATYGFQVFWNQNVFRDFVSAQMPAKSINPAGNLYVQGLTMNAQFDF